MRNALNFVLIIGLLFNGTDAFAAGKGYSSGGGSRSYSSGSSRSFSSSPKISTPSVSKPTPSVGKTYSSSPGKSYSSAPVNKAAPATGPPSKSYTNSGTSYSSKKPGGTFQSMAAGEQRKADSRAAYQQATAPKETYTTPKGNSVTIKKDDARVVQVRNVTEEKWIHREARVQTFYSTYYSHPPLTVVHYNDPYSTFFWLWMLDRSIDDRARWAYHHRYDMDDARYRDLLAKDARLEARIRQLEAEKRARDPNYLPPGMDDPDLPYTDEFVNASRNPTLRPYSGPTFFGFLYGLWCFILWCFYLALIVGVIWLFIWLVFYKEWN